MEQNNPFEKKDIDEDINDILRETPIENNVKKPKIQTYGKARKKLPFSRKQIFIGIGIAVLIGILYILFSSLGCDECPICEICNVCSQDLSIDNIKSQIITKGYAELSDGNIILKLAPYTG